MKYTGVRLITHAEPQAPYSYVAEAMPFGTDLSPKGFREARGIGRAWSSEGLSIDVIHTSPLMASRRTTEVALREYPADPTRPKPPVSQPPALHMRAMYEHMRQAQRSPNISAENNRAGSDLDIAARPNTWTLNTAAQMAGYLGSLRNFPDQAPSSVVTMTDQGSVNAMLALIEMGPLAALNSPSEHMRHAINMPLPDHASETLVVLEGMPGDGTLQAHAEYVNVAVWQDDMAL